MTLVHFIPERYQAARKATLSTYSCRLISSGTQIWYGALIGVWQNRPAQRNSKTPETQSGSRLQMLRNRQKLSYRCCRYRSLVPAVVSGAREVWRGFTMIGRDQADGRRRQAYPARPASWLPKAQHEPSGMHAAKSPVGTSQKEKRLSVWHGKESFRADGTE